VYATNEAPDKTVASCDWSVCQVHELHLTCMLPNQAGAATGQTLWSTLAEPEHQHYCMLHYQQCDYQELTPAVDHKRHLM
jgi:hypothetical protein